VFILRAREAAAASLVMTEWEGVGGRGWRKARDRFQQETNFANGAPRRLAPLDYIINCGI